MIMSKWIKENKITAATIIFILLIIIIIIGIVYSEKWSSKIGDLDKLNQLKQGVSGENEKTVEGLYPALSPDAKDIKLFSLNLNNDGKNDILVFYKLPYFLNNTEKNVLPNPYDSYINVFLADSTIGKYLKLKQHEHAFYNININNANAIKNINNPESIIIKDFNNDGKDEIFIKNELDDDIEHRQVWDLLRYFQETGGLVELPYSNEKITANHIIDAYAKAGKTSSLTTEIKNRIMGQIDKIDYNKANEIIIEGNIIKTVHYTHEEADVYPGIAVLTPSGPVIYTDWVVREGRIYIDKRQIDFRKAGAGDEGGE